eukprot:1231786-Pleurochrysis_carterae.AAC.4
MVLEIDLPLHARQSPLPDKVLKNKQQVEQIKNALDAKRMNTACLPISSALVPMDYGDEAVDVNGFGLQFISVNPAVSAMADDVVDNQGEQTDAALDGIYSSADSGARARNSPAAGGEGIYLQTPRPTQEERTTSLFETPTVSAKHSTASARARSGGEFASLPNLGAHAPNSDAPHAPFPKSWYTIIGGYFEGVRFANYKYE